MMTHDEMIAVIAAHRDGKKIQVKGSLSGIWSDIDTSRFNFMHCEYRVKPEPIVAWVIVGSDGHKISAWMMKESAERASIAYKGCRIVRMIEAEEGGEA